ncbi:phosphodiester glycosidase family protein [Nocardioides sp. SR21]|uniref:phosphodiester glycosidase family protein n=1 Tax=Nocardioides sp. SR21 TaxID=2919501 RepID=UPI001FA9989B|nr:phosphodiester glycosidase family protein [Nocardioides sp. SR21]
MHIRLTVTAAIAACGLLAAAPALAGPVGAPADHHRDHRSLHPEHTSGDEPGTPPPPEPLFGGRSTQTLMASWQVAPGVQFRRWTQTDARGPIVANLLTIDPRTPGLKIDYASMGAVRRTAPVPAILAKNRAIAGVNGDFYDIGHTGAPLGLGKDRQLGLLHARQGGWNNAFYIDRRGRAGIGDLPMTAKIRFHRDLTITNLNSPFVTPGGIGIYTHRWGRTAGYGVTQGQRENVRQVTVENGRVVMNRRKLSEDKDIAGLVIVGRGYSAALLRRELPVGTRVSVRRALAGNPQMAISGNRFLVNDGIIRAIDDSEMHPRTAIGIDSDTGEVLLLVVDGRSSRSRGYTMVELANLMVDLGADEAVNLDGGGSSTMVGRRGTRTKVLNQPSDGFLRSVANAIEVTYSPPRS